MKLAAVTTLVMLVTTLVTALLTDSWRDWP